MNGDSVQADEDRGETYDSMSLPQSKNNSCKRSVFQESGLAKSSTRVKMTPPI